MFEILKEYLKGFTRICQGVFIAYLWCSKNFLYFLWHFTIIILNIAKRHHLREFNKRNLILARVLNFCFFRGLSVLWKFLDVSCCFTFFYPLHITQKCRSSPTVQWSWILHKVTGLPSNITKCSVVSFCSYNFLIKFDWGNLWLGAFPELIAHKEQLFLYFAYRFLIRRHHSSIRNLNCFGRKI